MTENDYTPDVAQAAQVVMAEMTSRLTVGLSEKDGGAVAAAITKMGLRGFNIGVRACEREVRARLAPGVELPALTILDLDDQEEQEPDLWAEEYGGDADDDG